jgi:thiol:disulfide interchange protein
MEPSRKRIKPILLVAAALILLIASLASRQYTHSAANHLKTKTTVSDGTGIHWLTDLPLALAQAKETGRHIFVDFYADWCAPCKQLDAETLTNPRVLAASTNWLMVKIDVDRNPALAQYYNVQILPALLVLSPEGKELRRDLGFIPPAPMLSILQTPAATNSTSPPNTPPK